MTDEKKSTEIDISSTAIEKGIEVAKGFAEKLVLPSIEELGLLVKDQISYWRFNNQVKILNKAKLVCEKIKLALRRYRQNFCALTWNVPRLKMIQKCRETGRSCFQIWLILKKNIQNHVFPYILSQLSKDEFKLLEDVFKTKLQRVAELTQDLNLFLENRPVTERQLQEKIYIVQQKINDISPEGVHKYMPETWPLKLQLGNIKQELEFLKYKELTIRGKISAPQAIPEDNMQEFEIANIIRLGLAKVVYEASAGTHRIEVPRGETDSRLVDFDIQIETNSEIILTELGELFVAACSEK